MFGFGIALVFATFGLAAHFAPSKESVSRILVEKKAHTMTLFARRDDGEATLATYRVAIGPGGAGEKLREGDSVTPVGHYHIVFKKPSAYRVFMLLDYPNADDRARFAKLKASGALPKAARIGGDVGIHGAPPQPEWKTIHKDYDWTLGCVAVDDEEIESIAKIVPEGTPVDIRD